MKVAKGFLRPHVQPALARKTRGEFGDDERGGQKKTHRGKTPGGEGGSPVGPPRRTPARPQNRRNVKQQYVPKTHLFAQLLEGIGRAVHRLAHRVTSSAGINSSCMRKFLKKGSVEFSKPVHGPK